jgi:3-phenylpropionate/cinnamic acid dioxygenase small subunit
MVAQSDKKFQVRTKITPEYMQLYMQLLKEVEEFFYAEADILDFRQYSQWLELLTDDIRYFMPIVRNIKYGDWDREYTKEGVDIAWFDEGKATLTQRVRQIETGIHWAEEPSSRASHLVTNVRIIDAIPDIANATEVETTSRFFAYRNRLHYEVDIMVGKRLDRLRKVDGEWKLARREIILDQTVLLEKNITIFL